MRFILSLTGLFIIICLAYAAGTAGLSSIAGAVTTVSDVVSKVSGSEALAAGPRDAESTAAGSETARKEHFPRSTPEKEVGISPESDPYAVDRNRVGEPFAVGATARKDTPDIGNLFKSRKRSTGTAPAGFGAGDSSTVRDKQSPRARFNAAEYRAAPDRVYKIGSAPDGSFEYMVSKASVAVPRTLGLRGRRVALSRADLQARASLARAVQEYVGMKIQDHNRVQAHVSGDSTAGSHETSSDTTEYSETTVQTAEAILHGVVVLYQEVAEATGEQTAIVILGLNSRTIAAALDLQGQFNSQAESAVTSLSTSQPAAETQQSWATRDEDLQEMGF